MSVSIGWKRKDPKQLTYIDGASSFLKILNEELGQHPFELVEADIPFLKGVAACGYTGAEELIGAIREHDCIVLDAQY